MDLGEMTDAERTVNITAKFYAAHRTTDTGDLENLPCIEVGGVQVYAYVRDGALVVSVHLDTTDPDVFDLYGPHDAVPVMVKVGDDEPVFEAGPEESGQGTLTADETRALSVAAVDLWRLYSGSREDIPDDLREVLDKALRLDELESQR